MNGDVEKMDCLESENAPIALLEWDLGTHVLPYLYNTFEISKNNCNK